MPPSNLLTTVSRIVSNSEISSTYKPEQPKPLKKKPKALHVTMWIHIFSLIVTIVLGWIDMLPASGPVSHLKTETFADFFVRSVDVNILFYRLVQFLNFGMKLVKHSYAISIYNTKYLQK